MPKAPISFGDGLQRIIGDLAQMELDPSADRDLISQIRETIIGFQQQAGQGAPMGPDQGAGAVPGTLDTGGMPADPMAAGGAPAGLPVPLPVTEGNMSRAPQSGPNMGGAIEELQRVMSGA